MYTGEPCDIVGEIEKLSPKQIESIGIKLICGLSKIWNDVELFEMPHSLVVCNDTL